jgi:hypothetical protein
VKNITFVIEITAQIHDDVDPNNVTFDIDLNNLRPVVGLNNVDVGKAIGYETVNHFED